LSDSREAGIIAAQSFPKGWRSDRMMPASAIFSSNDIKAPGAPVGLVRLLKHTTRKKLNKFRAYTLASEKFHLFWGRNPWISSSPT
jgi:hypothetical protein